MSVIEQSVGEVVDVTHTSVQVRDLYSETLYQLNPTQINNLVLNVKDIIQYRISEQMLDAIELCADGISIQASLFRIAAKKQLHPFFSSAVQAEVGKILQDPGVFDDALVNMEALPFCTIDGKDTLDLDQALQIEQSETGFLVRYAIADAAYYIQPGSALFDEALRRGASFYLPGMMIPMLPRELCVDVISLNAQVLRRAIVFEMQLYADGQLKQSTIVRARIRSRGKLSFQQVQQFLNEGNEPTISQDETLSTSLLLFQHVGRLRIKLAEERNVARFHRTEINVKLDRGKGIFNLLDNVRNEVEMYNEQLSLLCNTVGAKFLADNHDLIADILQPIYKIHPPPSDQKLKNLEQTIIQLVKIHQLDPKIWQWAVSDNQPLADYLQKLPLKGQFKRISHAIHRQALLTNTRSEFSSQPGRHYGVGADVYARFSSPMREIVGVFLHKELMEKVDGCGQTQCSSQQDNVYREQIIQAANRAKDIQRQLTNEANLQVIDQFFNIDLQLEKSLRPYRIGTLLGVGRNKLYILLDGIHIEVKLYIDHLMESWQLPLSIDQDALCLINDNTQQPIIRLGDEVSLCVEEKDVDKNRWKFSLKKISFD